MHRRQVFERQIETLDHERTLGAELLVAALLDVGHPPRELHVRRDDARQFDALLQGVDLLDGPQVDLAVGRGAERRIAGQIRRMEGRGERIPGHPQAEFRELDLRAVHHAAGIRDPRRQVDVRDGLRQRRVLEAAVAHLALQLEGREPRALHLAARPQRQGQFAACRQILELPRIEGRNERQHILELDFVAAGLDIHRHDVILHLDPAVEPHADGIQPQRIVREGEAVVRQVGVDRRHKLRLGVAQQRNPARHEIRTLGFQPQVEVRAVGRQVAPQAQRQRIGREAHLRGVVLIADHRARDPEIPHRKPERRGLFGRRGLLRSLRGSLLRFRRLHHVPVDGPVGELVRMQRRVRKDHLRHLEPAVAEERHQVHDHRDPARRNNRVALEAVDAHQRQPLQFDRSVREVPQQADVEPFEIQFRGKHRVGLLFHDVGNLAPKGHRHDQCDRQNDHDDRGQNLHELFHSISVLQAKTVVSASLNPHFR